MHGSHEISLVPHSDSIIDKRREGDWKCEVSRRVLYLTPNARNLAIGSVR